MPLESKVTAKQFVASADRIRIGEITFHLDAPDNAFGSAFVQVLDANGDIIANRNVSFTKAELINGLNASTAAIVNAVKNKLGL